MRPKIHSILAALGVCGAIAWRAPATEPTLPGARADVQAIDFPSLQAAIDAVGEQGGVVRLPAGEFDIAEPLVISRSDVAIVGAGSATHIRNLNKSGQPAIYIGRADRRRVPRNEQLWRVSLSNLRVTGNAESGHGVEAVQVNEAFLHGVTISEHGGDGVRLDDCYEDSRVSDCLISYNKRVGLNALRCHDIVVSANHFEENQDAVHCVDGFNLCMSGNNLDDHLGDGVVIENTYGSIVSSNMIEECAGRGVVLDRDCYGDTISANVIAHNGSGVVLVDAHGCAVSANTFTIMRGPALEIGPASGRITVSGNNFANSYIGDNQVKRPENDRKAGGLVLDGTSDVVVAGNVFAGLSSKALDLRDDKARRIVFTGNIVVDAQSDHDRLAEPQVGVLKSK